MLFLLRVLCITILTLLSMTAKADPASNQLNYLLTQMRTMQANFSQTVTDKNGRVVEQSNGKMAIVRPGKFRWESYRPSHQIIFSDGRKIWIYDVDLEQVTIHSLNKAGQTPALFLSSSSAASLTNNFVVRQLNPGTYNLSAKNRNNLFSTVTLQFRGAALSGMKLEDRLGHVNQIRFQNIALNRALPSNLFYMRVPPNVDIIDDTRR